MTDMSEDDPYKLTSLMRAARETDSSIIVEMLAIHPEYHKTLFDKDAKGRTALDWARISNNHIAVGVLQEAMSVQMHDIRLGAIDTGAMNKPITAEVNRTQTKDLFEALRNRDGVAALRVLLNNKLFREEVKTLREVFFVDAQDQFGFTPLILASGMGLFDVVTALFELDVEIDHKNRFGHTALTWACATGQYEIVRMLLFRGADIHHVTNEGRTGLHYACLYAKSAVVDVLLKYLLERFATHQAKAQYKMYDKSRWDHYAALLENFIHVSTVTA